MINKGQIVEILATSPVYMRDIPEFSSKHEELLWKSSKREYSLFDGILVGEHSGIESFKRGQRKGINVGGKKEPLYVIDIDAASNRLFVGAGESHPGLWNSVLFFEKEQIHWHSDFNFDQQTLKTGITVDVKSSINESTILAILFIFETDVFLEFEKPVSMMIQDYPFSIIYQHSIIADFKIIK